MLNQAQVTQLCEDNELAFFRADVCLGSPESFSLEEKLRYTAGTPLSMLRSNARRSSPASGWDVVGDDPLLIRP